VTPSPATASPNTSGDPTGHDITTLVAAEKVLLAGLHSGERWTSGPTTVPDLARRDWATGWRPHHLQRLTRLRDHMIATRAPLVIWGQDYPRVFPWWPRSPTFDAWADDQVLTRTRLDTGDRIKHATGSAARTHQVTVDHAISMVTLLVTRPGPDRHALHRRLTGERHDEHHRWTPAAGFTSEYTAAFGEHAPLAWSAGLPITDAPLRKPPAALFLRAERRGYWSDLLPRSVPG
jgi:hypothetical protein